MSELLPIVQKFQYISNEQRQALLCIRFILKEAKYYEIIDPDDVGLPHQEREHTEDQSGELHKERFSVGGDHNPIVKKQ